MFRNMFKAAWQLRLQNCDTIQGQGRMTKYGWNKIGLVFFEARWATVFFYLLYVFMNLAFLISEENTKSTAPFLILFLSCHSAFSQRHCYFLRETTTGTFHSFCLPWELTKPNAFVSRISGSKKEESALQPRRHCKCPRLQTEITRDYVVSSVEATQ